MAFAAVRVVASTPAYLGPVTSTYTVRDTEWQSLSIPPFAVTVTRGGRTAYSCLADKN